MNGTYAGVGGYDPTRPWDVTWGGLWNVAQRVFGKISGDNLPIIAGGVTFFAMLAVFPALAAVVALYGLISDPQAVTNQIAAVSGVLPESAQAVLTNQLQRLVGSSAATLQIGTAIGILVALWSASRGMNALVQGLDIAYGEREDRGLIKQTLLVLGLTAGGLVFSIMALLLVAGVPAVLKAVGLGQAVEWLATLARWPVILGLAILALAAIYRLAPNRRPAQWRWLSPGAVVATTLWIIASILFSVYVSTFGSYSETYGALAGVVVLMFWFYITSFIVLLGGVINAEMERETCRDTTVGPPRPMGERDAVAADTVATS